MKKLLLLAGTALQAEEEGGKGFKNGTKFKMKVKRVESTVQTGYFGQATKAKVPRIFPRFKKGSRVRFQIRKKNLTGKGFNIDFAHGSKKVVEFNNFDQGDTANVAQTAEITRKGKRAKRGLMIFTITDFSTGTPVINTVTYYLK